ncbi:MAG: SagB/ThcOx family dehydrogenase [Prevotella sp.]|nr:SagB/ThcOx family dehydrogenase [Prevotella sp.]
MKKCLTCIILAVIAANLNAQEVKKLPQPDMQLNVTLMEALRKRRSDREFNAERMISEQQLSQLLWAACGVNRADRKLLTIPTAINAQDIQVYVCRKDGVSLYQPYDNTLVKVTDTDVREMLAERQQNMKTAPLFLLIVSNQEKFRNKNEIYGAMDAGYSSQNICLMCAALGLKTVPRAMMNKEGVAKALGLNEQQILELNHPIGY